MLGQSRLPEVKSPGILEVETDKKHSNLEAKRFFCIQQYGVHFDRASLGHSQQHVSGRGKTKAKENFTCSNLQNGVDNRSSGSSHPSKYHTKDGSAVLQQPTGGRYSWFSPLQWGNSSGQKVAEWPIRGRHHSATHDVNGEDWRSLSRALSTREKFSSISNRDLMRIAELRLSSDMQEGDSGSQVVLLQKALFWLGYLPTESSVTGYFCTKTKQALCEFQEAHGVNQTGIWGALSKQALWHNISGEILHRVADEKANKTTKSSSTARVGRSFAVQLSQILNPVTFSDAFTAEVSGIALLTTGMLLGVIVSRFYAHHSSNGKPLRRRVIYPKEVDNPPLLTPKDEHSKFKLNVNGATSSDNGLIATNTLPSTKDAETNHLNQKKAIRDPLPLQGDGLGMPNTSAMSFMPYRIGRKIMNSSVKPLRPMYSKSSGESGRTGKLYQASGLSIGNQSKNHSLNRTQFGRQEFVVGKTSSEASKSVPTMSKMPSKNLFETSSEGTRTAQREDNVDIKKRIEDLKKAVEEAEQNGQAAVQALAEERKRRIELEEKISRQRQSAAALEEEVRVLKESHDVLLESIRKKNSPSSARRDSFNYQGTGQDNDSN